MAFRKDGSGALAGDNITWDKDGNMNFKGKIDASQIISGKLIRLLLTQMQYYQMEMPGHY